MLSDTELISIFAVAATVSVTLLALLVALRQLSIHNQILRITIFREIKNEVATKEARASRNSLRQSEILSKFRLEYETMHAVSSFDCLDGLMEDIARDVEIMYDVVGFIPRSNRRLEHAVLAWHSDAIADMWLILLPLTELRWPAHYAPLFRKLGP